MTASKKYPNTMPEIPADTSELKKGQFIKVGWMDCKAGWMIVTEMPRGKRAKTGDFKAFDPDRGIIDDVGREQVIKVGEMFSPPD